MTHNQKLFYQEMFKFGGVCFGLFVAAGNDIGLYDENDFEEDLLRIQTLQAGSREVENIILALAEVCLENINPN